MVYQIDDIFPSRRYRGETIRVVLLKDSGYIKGLILKNESFALSDECTEKAKRITKGHCDNWKKPESPQTVFEGLKKYGVPYGFDFNDEAIQKINKQKQTSV